LNGVPEPDRGVGLRKVSDLKADSVIGSALPLVDILHMNEEELQLLTGCKLRNTEEMRLEDEFAIASATNLFLLCGVAIVVVTRGKKGSYVSCNDEDRFQKSPMLPSSWVDCTAKLPCVELPSGTIINTNGAGDSFTAGFLVAAMLRHTGMTVPVSTSPTRGSSSSGGFETPRSAATEVSFESTSTPPRRTTGSSPKPRKKLTPYQLYMRENYVALKQKCNDDKKKIFSVCHQMWEDESDDVKAFYERQADEEEEFANISQSTTEASLALQDQLDVLDSTPRRGASPSDHFGSNSFSPFGDINTNSFNNNNNNNNNGNDPSRNIYMTNRALNLESAVQFASLVASHHVDTATRDLTHLDVTRLLERALTLPEGLEEI